ncbi:ParB N-terminal domain-containing protein [Actinoplanes sp. NPDC049316]|uniref:ParB/RepB/Spo0J family partition protein n=1 Tax=Actinoplanes sp. NPDC049316 TaxID=3154727 RepID=UPI003434CD2E
MEPGDTTQSEPDGAGATEPEGYLLYLDPRDLLGHRGNLRSDLGDLTELQASIAGEGVLQALTVIPADGGRFRVVAGHRRTAAASAVLDAGEWNPAIAPTVPCLVRPDLADHPAEQVFAMLGENGPRVDLTVSERSRGYAQLAAFDVPPAEIARRTGIKVEHVKASIRLDAMSNDVKAKADAGQLNLDDILALKEFEDDPEVEQRIIAAAGTSWGARHEMAVERKKRKDNERAAELKAELKAAGVREVARPKAWPYESKAVAVHRLVDVDGKPLEVEAVKTTEGFAAFVDMQSSPVELVYVCLDPEGMGYTRPTGSSYRSPEEQRRASEKREADEKRWAALNVAASVRRKFIKETWGSAKAVKELLEEATRTAAIRPSDLTARDVQDFLAALAGGSLDNLQSARLDRLQRVFACRWIAAQEQHLIDVGRLGWEFKNRPEQAIAWFDKLVAKGYGLSPAEADLCERLTERVAQAAVETQQQAAAEREAQLRKATEVGGGDTVVFMLWPVPEGDIVNWQLVAGDGEHIDELPGDDVAQVQQWAAGVLDEMGFVATAWQQRHDEASSTTYYVIDLEEGDGCAEEPAPVNGEPEAADGEPDVSAADGGDDQGEPVFALFAVDAGGKPQWWLTDDDFGTAIADLDAGPDEVGKAQEWAADVLARMQMPIAGWRLVGRTDLVPDHYLAVWGDEQDDLPAQAGSAADDTAEGETI